MLKIEKQQADHHVILRCSGRIVLGEELEVLRSTAQALFDGRILVDLAQVESLDAAGLGLLVQLQLWARRQHKVLQLVDPSPRALRLLAITHLQSVLDIVRVERTRDGRALAIYGRQQAMSA